MVVLQGTRFGHLTVDGRDYAHDIWVLPDGGVRERPPLEFFAVPEAERLLAFHPQVIVVGRGFSSRLRVDEAARALLLREGVTLVEARTSEALRVVNDLRNRQRVAAVLHVTD